MSTRPTSPDPSDAAGPPRRRYDSPLRRERAAATRAAVIEASAQAFSDHGYNGATMAQIAGTAGVSADTVGLIGNKAFLLLEAFRTRYAGGGGWQSLLEQSDVQEIFDIEDPAEGIDATVEFLARGHSRSARLWLVVRTTAATDPQVAEEFAELTRLKNESFLHTTRWLVRIGVLPPAGDGVHDADAGVDDVSPGLRRLVAEVSLLMSAEIYLLLTADHGYSLDDYREWLTARLREQRT